MIEAELPDGTILEFPDGTPDDVVQGAVRSNLASQGPRQSFAAGAREELLQGATLGFSDEIQSFIAAAVAAPFVSDKTFGQLMVDARNSIREDRESFTKENPKTAIALNVAGGLATTGGVGAARQAAAKTAGQAARAGAVTGAEIGAVAGAGFADAPELLSLDTALSAAAGAGSGAAIGAALPAVIQKASNAIRGIVRKPTLQVFDETGKFTDDAMKELNSLVSSGQASADDVNAIVQRNLADDGVLTPEQAARFNLFQRRKVTPTRPNITQAADDFVEQQSALKRSGPVAERVAQQDRQIQTAVQSAADDIAPATSLPEVNASINKAITQFAERSDEIVSQAYKAAEKEAAGQPRVSLDGLMKAIQSNRGSENVSGGVISSLRGVLRNKGLIRSGENLDINKRGPGTAGIARMTTVREAEEVRKHLNSLYDSVSPQGRRLIGKLKDAIDDDVANAVGDDIFAQARQAKIERQNVISRGRKNKFDTGKDSLFDKLINNEIPEEKILQTLTSKSTRLDEFKNLKQFLIGDLDPETLARAEAVGRLPAGVQAWRDMKAQVLRGALDDALSTQGKGEGGGAVFNVRKFRQAFQGLKEGGKFNELFDPAERKLVEDIIEIGNLRLPVTLTNMGKGPTELAVGELRREVLKKIPVVGERAQDLLEAVSNAKAERRLLDVTRETERALTR